MTAHLASAGNGSNVVTIIVIHYPREMMTQINNYMAHHRNNPQFAKSTHDGVMNNVPATSWT